MAEATTNLGKTASGKAYVPLYIAVRLRELTPDIVRGEVKWGLRLFCFWKRALCPAWPDNEECALDSAHPAMGIPMGREIPKTLDMHIPTCGVMGKVHSDEKEDESGLRELMFKGEGVVQTRTTVDGVDGAGEDAPDCLLTMMQHRVTTQTFDLHRFPFDEQEVEAYLRLPKANSKDSHFKIIVDDQLEVAKENIRPTDQPNGHGPFELTPSVTNKLSEEWEIVETHFAHNDKFPDRAKMTVRLRRKSRYYVMRMIVPSGVCASLSMTAWNLSNGEFEGRAAILVTLFLALVASGNTYTALLPRVPYLTALDRYMSACMAFCTLVIVGCVVGSPPRASYGLLFSRGGGESAARALIDLDGNLTDLSSVGESEAETSARLLWETVDVGCMFFLAIGWIVYHLHFYCVFVRPVLRQYRVRRKKMAQAKVEKQKQKDKDKELVSGSRAVSGRL